MRKLLDLLNCRLPWVSLYQEVRPV